jgi:hypothetical protein
MAFRQVVKYFVSYLVTLLDNRHNLNIQNYCSRKYSLTVTIERPIDNASILGNEQNRCRTIGISFNDFFVKLLVAIAAKYQFYLNLT